MNKQNALAVAAIAVGLVVIAGVMVLFVSQPQQPAQTTTTTTTTTPEPEITYYTESTVFTIDGAGNATAEWTMEMTPSTFTDLNILPITGGTLGLTEVHGIGTENGALFYMSSLQESYSYYGLEMTSPSAEFSHLEIGGSMMITARWEVPHMAHREDGKWVISLNPVDAAGHAGHVINNIKELQANLSIMPMLTPGGSQLVNSYSMTFVLPEGAVISNSGDVAALNYSIDYGGGTTENDSAYISEVGGAQALVVGGQASVGTDLITITEEEFIAANHYPTIEYTGVDPPADFVESASWVAVDMKFGQERPLYTISLDGAEHEVTAEQLLYYVATEVAALADGGPGAALAGGELIQVAPSDSESGEWDAFLKTLTADDLAALARDARDAIESTGNVPATFITPIGSLRPRDALFTLLRALSHYAEGGTLPYELRFAPAPTGNLSKGDAEVPAELAYFTLGEKYVNTGTPRINQLISDLWQPSFSESDFAENTNGWVYQEITYQLVMGIFTSEEVLDMKAGKCLDKSNLYMAITRTAGMPTRMVSGFLVFDQPSPTFQDIQGVTPDGRYILGHAWVEVYLAGQGWVFADPTNDFFSENPFRADIYSRVEQTWQEVLADYEATYGELI